MNFFVQILVLFALCFCGDLIASILPIAVPGSMISMILLLVLLIFRAVKTDQIRQSTEFLQHRMAFFTLPACVALIDNLPVLKKIIIPFLIIVTASTILTFIFTAGATIFATRVMEKLAKHTARKTGGVQ